ncbi:hypothetical protein ONR57_21520 [Hoyosella sp. YIM 151337]|uniref:hypothetical protein n=1 Tax=Hoyosella sp. YIM 151337 TaxID=2992742 RepID=UPI002236BFB6|nr:hypothetical protein [Hoyosella sp. YIM 151337]MCW4355888.1 hypothetical protein [Hoyosella sp. YIM 151337]
MATTPKAAKPTTHLTDEQLRELADTVAAGKRATVYLREPLPGQGLEAGASARVVAVDGRTVIVRPRGVDDEIPFEAEELRRTKAAPAEPKKAPPAKSSTRKAPSKRAAGAPAEPPRPPEVSVPAPVRRRAASKAGPCALILRSDESGEWTLEVERPGGQQLKPARIQPDVVVRAVRELQNPAAVKTVENALSAAREAAAKRVDELKRKLQEAESALNSLDSDG